MKVRAGMIRKELRAAGMAFKILNGTFTTTRFRLFAWLMKRIKIPVVNNAILSETKWIAREDVTRIRLRTYRSKAKRAGLPGVLWLHGGGYAIGVPEQCQRIATRLIKASNCVIVAPDYLLSVEAPYPAALEDAYTALLWMKDHAEVLGIRSDQLIVGGESAGGGLTAALTLYARDRAEVAIAFQMPLYPMLDDRMATDSAKDNNAPVWNSRSNRNAWKLYLDGPFSSTEVPPYAAPGRAKNYAGLPPIATFVGELEPFRDETIEYVENLRKAGVEVCFKVYPGCYHGFDVVCPRAKVTEEAMSFLMTAYRYAVHHYFAAQKHSTGCAR